MVAQVDVGTAGALVDGADAVPGNIAQGIQLTSAATTPNQFGAVGAVQVGMNGVPVGNFLSTSSIGNAATVLGMTDAIADVLDGFSITYSPAFGGTSPAGTRTLTPADFAGVSTLAQLIAVIDAIDGSGPSAGIQATIDGNGALQITSPFLSKIDSVVLSSTTGLAAEASTVDITGVSDAEAADVTVFQITIDGVPLDTSALDFSGVTSRAELATVLDALPGIAVTESVDSGGTISITAEATGPKSFTSVVLGDLTLTAATARLAADDLAALDAKVAAAESFALKLNGSDLDVSSLDFGAIATAADLAAALDALAGISAQVSGAGVTITSDALGAGNAFSDLQLIDNEATPATAATTSIAGIDAFAGEASDFDLLVDGNPVDTSAVDFVAATDGTSLAAELDKIDGIGVSYSADNGGTLLITADTPGALAFSGLALTRPNTLTGSDGIDDVLTGDALGMLIQGLGGDDTLTGLGGDDRLEGGEGNDLIVSSAGSDSYDGGDGIDTIWFTGIPAGTGVFVQLVSDLIQNDGFGPVSEAIVNVENVIGSDGGDVIRGTTGANVIEGLGNVDFLRGDDGDDVLVGGADGDELDGGADSDTARYDVAVSGGTLVIDLAAPGNNTGEAAGDSYISIENVTGSNGADLIRGDASDNVLFGRKGADTIDGGDGNDIIDGGKGADEMAGGTGNDVYYVDDAGDVVTEEEGGGKDLVAVRASYALGADSHVETLRTTSNAGTYAIDLTGNGFAQRIIGNAADNLIDGGKGADKMIGLDGDDIYVVDHVRDAVIEETGGGAADLVGVRVSYALGADSQVETLRTTSHHGLSNLDLTGNGFDQTVVGNDGDNRIDGGGGNDTLRGRGGEDTFVFSAAPAAGNVDHIIDFRPGDDTIELSQAVFSALPSGALAVSAFHIGAEATSANHHIIYDAVAGVLSYDADGSGSGGATAFATLQSGLALTHDDFVLA
jgi:Ca2+-binding RTX toxin-like protein